MHFRGVIIVELVMYTCDFIVSTTIFLKLLIYLLSKQTGQASFILVCVVVNRLFFKFAAGVIPLFSFVSYF